MAEALILEFDGDVGKQHYDNVNRTLGIDPGSGEGDWPQGMIFHSGAAKPGGWVVFEIWDSKDAQERFMAERLGPALQQNDVPPPSRAEWLELAAHHTPA
jgi:hypothetical protein